MFMLNNMVFYAEYKPAGYNAINVTTILKVKMQRIFYVCSCVLFLNNVEAPRWQNEVLNEDWSVKESCGVHAT